jgi:hypothetical protein
MTGLSHNLHSQHCAPAGAAADPRAAVEAAVGAAPDDYPKAIS